MAERVQRKRVTQRADAETPQPQATSTTQPVDYDKLLDQIDAVLETDAEEYVRSFVQRGGQ